MTCCILCGSRLPDDDRLSVSLDVNVIRCGAVQLRVTAKLCELAYTLNRRAPVPVPFDTCISALWGVREPRDARAQLKTYAHLLRKVLRQLGFNVVAHRGVGYAIERDIGTRADSTRRNSTARERLAGQRPQPSPGG